MSNNIQEIRELARKNNMSVSGVYSRLKRGVSPSRKVHGHSKLDVETIRGIRESKLSTRELMEKYNVTSAVVYGIKANRTHRNIK